MYKVGLLANGYKMMITKKWYAVYTKVHREKKTADLLQKNKIESYCPLNKTISQWSDRKKIIFRPLFSSYVFVYASELEFLTIRKTEGVINFVYWLGKPAIIKDHEIEVIKEFMEHHHNVKVMRINVNINDTVKIKEGPMALMQGRVIELGNQTIKISLPSFGFAMVAEVSKQNAELVC